MKPDHLHTGGTSAGLCTQQSSDLGRSVLQNWLGQKLSVLQEVNDTVRPEFSDQYISRHITDMTNWPTIY